MWLLNIFFLMFVSLLPFSTAMLGAFTLRQPATLAIYFGNQLGLGLLLNAQWFYASRRHLIVRQEDDRRLRLFRTQVGLQPVACVLAMAVLPLRPDCGLGVFATVLLAARLAGRRRLRM